MLKIKRHIASCGYDRTHCWVNPVALPGDENIIIITQKLFINAIDCFSDISLLRSSDGGQHWSNPEAIAALADTTCADNSRKAFMTSVLHRCRNGKILVIVTTFNYTPQNRRDRLDPQRVKYLYFDPADNSWSPMRELDLHTPADADVLAVNAQLTVYGDDFLLPYCVRMPSSKFYSGVARISSSADGSLSATEFSELLTSSDGRGFLEPSLCCFDGKYYLSLRNDLSGYVCCSADWKHFPEPEKWCFSNLTWLGNCNTMNRLLSIGGKLYLVYTRKGLNNDHVFRNRAPLMIAQVDPEKLSVLPESEQILVPEHGARLGNFTAVSIDRNRAYISVAEWMQTLEPDCYDCKKCEEYGADNRIWYVTLNA